MDMIDLIFIGLMIVLFFVASNAHEKLTAFIKVLISFLLGWFVFVSPLESQSIYGWIVAALSISIMADAILQVRHMVRTYRRILLASGIILFMVVQAVWSGFFISQLKSPFPIEVTLVYGTFLLIGLTLIYQKVSIPSRGIKDLIILYGLLLGTMVLLALINALQHQWQSDVTRRFIGAFLFALSDVLLIPLYFTRFRPPWLRAIHLVLFYVGEALMLR